MSLKCLCWFLFIYSITLWQGCSGDHEQGVDGSKKCGPTKLDLVFIVDSSGSVTSYNFQKTKDFIQNVIDQLPVQGDAIRIAIIRYSTRADIITFLNDDMDQSEKSAVLQSMAYRPGSTKTHIALQLTNRIVLHSQRGDRPDVPNLVILITDGVSTNTKFTSREARLLKERPDVKILVVGIGSTLRNDELLAVASSPQMVHRVTSFSKLQDIVESLSTLTCSDILPDDEKKISTSPSPTSSLPTTQKTEYQLPLAESTPTTSLLSLLSTTASQSSLLVSQSVLTSISKSSPYTLESYSANPGSTIILASSASKEVMVSPLLISSVSLLLSPASSDTIDTSEPSLSMQPSATYEFYSTTSVTGISLIDTEITTSLASHMNGLQILQPSSASMSINTVHVLGHTPIARLSSEATGFRKLGMDTSIKTLSYFSSSYALYKTTALPSSFATSSLTNYVSDTFDWKSTQTLLTSTVDPENHVYPDVTNSSAAPATLELIISPTSTAESTADASTEELDMVSMVTSIPSYNLPLESFVTAKFPVFTSLMSPSYLERQETMAAHSDVSHKPIYVSHTPMPVSQTMTQGVDDNNATTGLPYYREADVASSDLYLFVAAGAAGAVVLTAATICITLMCRKQILRDEAEA